MKVKSLSCLTLETPWTAAYQAPPSMGFSRQEYWSGVPSPSLIKCFRTLIFMDTHFHGQLSSVFLLQVTYYSFLIFIMHSFLKLWLSSYHLHYITFFLYYLPLGKLRIVPHYSHKLRAFSSFETILLKVIAVLPWWGKPD